MFRMLDKQIFSFEYLREKQCNRSTVFIGIKLNKFTENITKEI